MDHEQAFELLPGYLDQELSLSEALEFERHLAGCEQCQQVYSQHRQVSAQLRRADLRVEVPAELVKRIKAALPGRPSLWQRLVELFGWRSGGGSLGWAPVGAMVMSVVAPDSRVMGEPEASEIAIWIRSTLPGPVALKIVAGLPGV